MRFVQFAAVMAGVLASCAQAQQTSSPPEVPVEHPGKVIFSRSLDQNGTPEKPATPPAGTPATDAERQAITFLAYDLDVHFGARW